MKALIIGCGKQAEKHLSGYLANGVSDIVVADVDVEIAARFARKYSSNCNICSFDTRSALEQGEVEVASICTPTLTHAALIGECIERGIHFLCEKPLAEDLETAIAIDRSARENNVQGMVGYTYRFAPQYGWIRQILTDAAQPIGPLSNALFRIGGRGSHASWKHSKSSGGGAVNEMLVHMLDLAHWLIGPLRNLTLTDSNLTWRTRSVGQSTVSCDAEDWVVVRARSFEGIPVLIQADFTTPMFSQYVEINGLNGNVFGSITTHHETVALLNEARGGLLKGKNRHEPPAGNLYQKIISSFLGVTNGECPNPSPVSDSVFVMRYLEELTK